MPKLKLSPLYFLLSGCVLFALPVLVKADALKANRLFNMSLEELSSLPVAINIGSVGTTENVIYLPNIVSTYNIDDMQAMGLSSLGQILNAMPGVRFIEANNQGQAIFRGIPETFNQKVLFMIDGVPYTSPSHGDLAIDAVPLHVIEKIEVIRGPGTVVYGTNANAGVINLVTKKHSKAVNVEIGEHKRQYYSFSYSKEVLHGDLLFSFAHRQEDGYAGIYQDVPVPPSYPTTTPTEGSVNKNRDYDSALVKFTAENINLSVQYYQSQYGSLAGTGTAINRAQIHNKGYLLHGDKSVGDSDNLWSFYGDYNNFHPIFDTDNTLANGTVDGELSFANSGEDNYRWRLGLSQQVELLPELSLYWGLETEKRATGDYDLRNKQGQLALKLMKKDQMRENSLFAQLDWQLLNWRFIAGGRHIDNDKNGDNFSPRFSAVYSLDDGQSLKLLHASGFSSPVFIQTSIDIPNAVLGDPKVNPEVITTTDLAYNYLGQDSLFVATFFYAKAEDFIARLPNPDAGGVKFSNVSAYKRSGLELDWQYQANNINYFANLSYIRQGNQLKNDDIAAIHTPRWDFSSGGDYRFNSHHRLGASINWLSKRNNMGSYHRLNINYRFTYQHWQITTRVENALDKEQRESDSINFDPFASFPIGDGRNFSLALSYQF